MKRQPEGVPAGGQFAADKKSEPTGSLAVYDDYQQDPAQEKFAQDLWVGQTFRLQDIPVVGADLAAFGFSADKARVQELMAEDGVATTGVVKSHTETHMGEDGTAYAITFKRTDEDGNECELEVPFSTGSARQMAPTSSDVLNTYIGDAVAWEDAGTVEDWAEELGLDMDDPQDKATAEKAWANGEEINEKLREFLGSDRFDQYAYMS